MSETLKPCPFCGYEKPRPDPRGAPWIWCPSCDADGPVAHDDKPEDLWNTRAEPPQD